MKKKALCLIYGTALAGAISVASADEPLTLSADQMDQVTAAGGLVNLTDGLIRFSEIQSGLGSTLFTSLTTPTDETVETTLFGSIERKSTEIRDRIFSMNIELTNVGIPD